MTNRYDATSAPLIPFALPGGSLQVSVIKPDGTTDNLGSLPLIVQNQLSTAAQDERALFGDASRRWTIYRLTTLNPTFNARTRSTSTATTPINADAAA